MVTLEDFALNQLLFTTNEFGKALDQEKNFEWYSVTLLKRLIEFGIRVYYRN